MMDEVLVSRFQWFEVDELLVQMVNDRLMILTAFDGLLRLHVKIEETIEARFDFMINTLKLFLLPGDFLLQSTSLLLFHKYYSS